MTMNEIRFPELKSFSDVFMAWQPEKDGAAVPVAFPKEDRYYTRKGNPRTRTVNVKVGPYCSIHDLVGYRHVYVASVRPEIADYLRKNWIGTGDGSFQCIIRDDGTALITAQYEQIIGSHWLALVDASTVPAAPKEY